MIAIIIKILVKTVENVFRGYLLKHANSSVKNIIRGLLEPTELDTGRLGEYVYYLIVASVNYWALTYDLMFLLSDNLPSLWNYFQTISFEQSIDLVSESILNESLVENDVSADHSKLDLHEQPLNSHEKNLDSKVERPLIFTIRMDLIIVGFWLFLRLN